MGVVVTLDDVVTMLIAEAAISANVSGRWSDGGIVWTMAVERGRLVERAMRAGWAFR